MKVSLFIVVMLSIVLTGCFKSEEEKELAKKQAWLKKYQKEGTFADYNTKLVWQDDTSVKTTEKNWDDAIKHCQNLNLAGYNDWRLPTYNELLTIVDYEKFRPVIKSGFKNVASNFYWSSSEDVSGSSKAWFVFFYSGGTSYGNKSGKFYVRCVRGK